MTLSNKIVSAEEEDAPSILPDGISVRLADGQADIEAAQNLRYKVFYKERSAIPSVEMEATERDFDEYDRISDHLVVTHTENGTDEIVGTYRLLRQEVAEKHGGFYTASEYDISPILESGGKLLELGRSCVLEPFRTRPVLQMLWQGIADYVLSRDIDLMFGCASLHGTDLSSMKERLSYLYYHHLAQPALCPKALESRYVDMRFLPKEAIHPREAFSSLPPLIKGYLRLGAGIGDGAVVDHQFNTTDVCIVLPTHLVTSRYKRHYERAIRRSFPTALED